MQIYTKDGERWKRAIPAGADTHAHAGSDLSARLQACLGAKLHFSLWDFDDHVDDISKCAAPAPAASLSMHTVNATDSWVCNCSTATHTAMLHPVPVQSDRIPCCQRLQPLSLVSTQNPGNHSQALVVCGSCGRMLRAADTAR